MCSQKGADFVYLTHGSCALNPELSGPIMVPGHVAKLSGARSRLRLGLGLGGDVPETGLVQISFVLTPQARISRYRSTDASESNFLSTEPTHLALCL